MEIRCHIYSFLYLEHRIVNFIHPKLYYIKTALYLSCQQLYQETLEYYYGRNTFSLHIHHQFVASDCRSLPRHFDLVKVLRIESLTFFWRLVNDVTSSLYTENCRRRLEDNLEAILGANKGTWAPNLKTLILADEVPPQSTHWDWCSVVDNPKERLEEYMQVFDRLQIGVGQVVVDITQAHEGEGLN